MPAKRMTPALGMEALIGQTIGSHYTLQRLLGRGTKALAFLATHRTMHRTVVVQLLNVPWADDKAAVARFEEHAKALAGLEHPNIAAVHDFGRDPGRVWVAVEYVEGELLSDYIRRMGRLQLEAFVPIAAQILKGLGGAHARQILHRDLKAASVVLVEEQGRANYVKLLDLGIASLLEGPPDRDDDPPLVGEPAYLAPEVIMNKPADARSDVYAVGVLFYQMLTGRLPIEGDSAKDILHRHVNDKPAPLANALPPGHNVPDGLIEMIHDCLAKNPDNRPNDANEIVERMIDSVPAAMFRLPVAAPRPKTAPINVAGLRAETDAQAHARTATLAAAVEASGARPIQQFDQPAQTVPDIKQGGGGGWVLALLAIIGVGVGVYFYLESQKTPPVPPVTQPQPTTAAAGLAKAQEFEAAGKLAEALAAYEVVLVTDPNNSTAKERASALKAQIAQADTKVEAPPDTKVEPPPDTKVEPPPDTKVETPPDTKVEAPPDTKVETPPDTKVAPAGPVKLSFTSTPTKAEVWIDGELKGKTPLAVEVPAGARTVEIKAKGFETYTETVEAAADGKKDVTAKLKRLDRKTFRDQENAASEEIDPEDGVGTNLEVPLGKRGG
jgi:hypothetical protein